MRKLLAVLLVTLATGAAAADFTSLDRPTGRNLTAAASHTRPTVVALWASDCVYCKKNLRTLAALAKANRQLRIITVATEVPGPATRPEIDKTGVPGERYAYGDDVPEALAYALDPHWRGELPRTYLFDGKGGVQAVSGVIDAAGCRAALQLK
jgi:thiol-disulfide isomerase/thioredoxin